MDCISDGEKLPIWKYDAQQAAFATRLVVRLILGNGMDMLMRFIWFMNRRFTMKERQRTAKMPEYIFMTVMSDFAVNTVSNPMYQEKHTHTITLLPSIFSQTLSMHGFLFSMMKSRLEILRTCFRKTGFI